MISANDENTLGFTLELYSRYMEAAKVIWTVIICY